MNTRVNFAPPVRVGTLLCSVLFAACGNNIDRGHLQAISQAPQLLAESVSTVLPSDLYVSPSGNDGNAGSQAAPFKTISRASQAATPGVTIHVAAGSYPGSFQTTASGTADARIRYVSDTRLGAKIVPPASSASAFAWDNRGSYVDIDGFEVDGSAIQAGTRWMNGIYTAGSYAVVRNNHVHHIANTAACSGSGGAIGSDSYYKGTANDVMANIVHDVGPAGCAGFFGIYLNTASSKAGNNLVYNISDAGIRMSRDASNMLVSNNMVFNAGTGVLVSGDGGYIGTAANDYTHVSNNILIDNVHYGVQESGSTGVNNRYLSNLVYRNGSDYLLSNGLQPVNSISADPLLVNYVKNGGGDYHLTASSPAIGKAASADAPSTDFDGKPRDAIDGIDIGIYEHAATVISDPTTLPATTYNFYVSPNGSDSAAGTQASPWKTLARAASAVKPSTTVFVAPGTYAGGLKTTISGTASARIYFVSTSKWGAKIVPPASSGNDTAWDNRGNYVDIVGFEVNGSATQSGTKWLHGIYNGGSYDMIRNNHVHHIATSVSCTSAGGSAIGVDSYYHGMKTDVIGNLVHDIGPAGCKYVQGIYMSTSGSVKNNVVYRVAEAAIHLWHDANNVIITGNTVATSHTGIIVGGGDYYYTSGPDDYTAVYNNIVYDNTYGISEQGSTGVHNTYRNNLVYQNTYNWTLKNGLTASGTVTAAPGFVSYTRTGTSDFHLASGSPAIGKGTSTNALPYDFDGKPRNSSTGYDIGAYQH